MQQINTPFGARITLYGSEGISTGILMRVSMLNKEDSRSAETFLDARAATQLAEGLAEEVRELKFRRGVAYESELRNVIREATLKDEVDVTQEDQVVAAVIHFIEGL